MDYAAFARDLKKQNTEKQDINRIIFGKNIIDRIVSIEVDEDIIFIYRELEDGTVDVKNIPNDYWLVSNRAKEEHSERLKGTLHYKWITKYQDRDTFLEARKWGFRSNDFSIYDPKESAMVLNGLTYFKGMKVADVSVLSFDIETTGLIHNKDSKVLLISNTFRKNGEIIKKLFAYDDYDTDAGLFDAWCDWVREINPSIMLGHNVMGYDFPYLMFCADNAGTTLKLGRDDSDIRQNDRTTKFRKDGSQSYDYFNMFIFGREIIDTFFLSIKYDFARSYISYGLKQIIEQEGLQKADRTFYDAATIKNNYKNSDEWEKIKEYAKDDADDSLALYDLMINSYFYYSQSIPKSFQSLNNGATGSQLNAFMIRAYLQDGKSLPLKSETVPYEGAICDGFPGIYKHVMKMDVASLYPSIMIEFDVGDRRKDPDGVFGRTVKYFTEQRLENKRLGKETGDRHYKDLEQAQKIVINSLYGFMGAPGLMFNSPENAAFVTRKGREILTIGMNWVESKGYTLVNLDTDSFSYSKSREITQDEFNDDLVEVNKLFSDGISWEDDGMYKTVIVIKAKNYVLDDGKTIKYKGSALKDQKKEPALKEMLEVMMFKMLNEKEHELPDVYKTYVRESQNITDISRWVTKKTITKPVLDSRKKGARANESKVLDAMEESIRQKVVETYSEGEKLWVYTAIDGEVQKMEKGEGIIFKKTGLPKMIPNNILRVRELWGQDENKNHYAERVFKTVSILKGLLDMNDFKNYKLAKNKNELVDL